MGEGNLSEKGQMGETEEELGNDCTDEAAGPSPPLPPQVLGTYTSVCWRDTDCSLPFALCQGLKDEKATAPSLGQEVGKGWRPGHLAAELG